MEQSAFEAVITGVNTFIFAISLTFGIILMTNVLEMADIANKTAILSSGSLINSMGTVEDRIIKGSDLLTYYRKLETLDYKFYVSPLLSARTKELKQYIEETPMKDYINNTFEIVYNGKAEKEDSNGNKLEVDVYTFVKQK